jgi:pimeloyl-ACP methyl ester carboxylesterase
MPTMLADDGVTLSYQVHGHGPTTVLYMHGWAGSGAQFDGVIGELDLNALQVVTMDFRGHGESEKTAEPYGLDRIADDAWAVADTVGARHVVLVS